MKYMSKPFKIFLKTLLNYPVRMLILIT